MYKILTFLVFVIGLVAFATYPRRPGDEALYQQLVKNNQEANGGVDELLSYSEQKRGEVKKHVWYQGKTPLEIEINSQESELFFFKQAGQIEIIEQLEKVTCIMQEELYCVDGKPMQRIRYLEAERASYNYMTHLFIGQEVKIWKFQLEGHTIVHEKPPLPPLMEAVAQSVEFTLKGEELNFVAHQMRAVLYPSLGRNTPEKLL